MRQQIVSIANKSVAAKSPAELPQVVDPVPVLASTAADFVGTIKWEELLEWSLPLWLELVLALCCALAIAVLKGGYLKKGSKPREVSSDDVREQAVLRKSLEEQAASGRSGRAVDMWRASNTKVAISSDLLSTLVQVMHSGGMEAVALADEVVEHMAAHASQLATPRAVVAVLDGALRVGGLDLLRAIAVAAEDSLRPAFNAPLVQESLLGLYAAAGATADVEALKAALAARGRRSSARGCALVIGGFLRQGLLDKALTEIHEAQKFGFQLPPSMTADLMRTALDAGRAGEVLKRAREGQVLLHADAIAVVLDDCLRRHDLHLCAEVERLVAEGKASLPAGSLEMLLRVHAPTGSQHALELFEELKRSGTRLSHGFCMSILMRCAEAKFLPLAEDLVELLRSRESMTVQLYSALMKVYACAGLYHKACDLYGQLKGEGFEPDSIMYGCLMKFAADCGRNDLLEELASKVDAPDMHNCMALIRAAGQEKDVGRAFRVLDRMRSLKLQPDVAVYNCVLDVCSNAGDLARGRRLLDEMRSSSGELPAPDLVSYNILLKGFCGCHDMAGAQAVMEEMEAAGFAPNDVSYNSFINVAVSTRDFARAWKTVETMQQKGVAVDKYTISTMLKSLKGAGSSKDVGRVLALFDSLELDICKDEILLNGVIDCCIRHSEFRRLRELLDAVQMSALRPAVHTYGCLIRAHSTLRQPDRCWQLWESMTKGRGLVPTSIVLGCMIDALVCNGEIQQAEVFFYEWRAKVPFNSVMYSTLIKGFATSHMADRAMSMLREMRHDGVGMSTAVYNTVLDAQARVGDTATIREVLRLLDEDKCLRDPVTFSIVVKGYCVAGDLERGFEVFKDLQQAYGVTRGSPSSSHDCVTVAYNTLLDGCVQHNQMELADRLLASMDRLDVQPTNFTLGIVVKMWGRRRQVDRALEAVASWSKKYHITPNGPVKTCLMLTCIKNNRLQEASKIFADLRDLGLADSKAICVLLSGFLRHHQLDRAAQLVEEAYGLEGSNCRRVLPVGSDLDAEVLERLLRSLAQNGQAARMQRILRGLVAAKVPGSGRLLRLVSLQGDGRGPAASNGQTSKYSNTRG